MNINVTDSSPALYTSRYSCVVSTRWSQTVAVAPVVVVAGIVAAVAAAAAAAVPPWPGLSEAAPAGPAAGPWPLGKGGLLAFGFLWLEL